MRTRRGRKAASPQNVVPKGKLLPVDLRSAESRYLEIYSDATDTRTDEEVSQELGVDPSQLLRWRDDPEFAAEADFRFAQSLARGGKIMIFKKLVQQSKGGSTASTRILLESLGQLKQKGDVTINVGGGASHPYADVVESLSDSELDSEIGRLLELTSPGDVMLRSKRVMPVSEAEYETVGSVEAEPDSGGVDPEGGASEALLVSGGETPEDVG